MQRLAIISDTHWNVWDPSNPEVLRFQVAMMGGYDQIWHGGDVVDGSVLEALEGLAPVRCVKGNCDSFMGRNLPHSVVETVEQVKIAMIHGWDLPLDHAPTVAARFADDVRVIIHGHTHRRRDQEVTRADGSKVTLINPGSVSSPRGGEQPGYGELLIDGSEWVYRSVTLD